MNVPTIIGTVIVAGIFIAIVARGIYNKRHGKGACSCGGDCGNCRCCHEK